MDALGWSASDGGERCRWDATQNRGISFARWAPRLPVNSTFGQNSADANSKVGLSRFSRWRRQGAVDSPLRRVVFNQHPGGDPKEFMTGSLRLATERKR
jgi:hypothetical protein